MGKDAAALLQRVRADAADAIRQGNKQHKISAGDWRLRASLLTVGGLPKMTAEDWHRVLSTRDAPGRLPKLTAEQLRQLAEQVNPTPRLPKLTPAAILELARQCRMTSVPMGLYHPLPVSLSTFVPASVRERNK